MARDASATQQRLIAAAAAEFAQYGIAGARVDRIAEQSGSNKAQIYHYFGSKEALFDAVFDAVCASGADANPVDVDDMPGYAGRIFDSFFDNPQISRLLAWYRLERGGAVPNPAVLRSLEKKVATIAAAQTAGKLPTRFAAAELMALLVHIGEMWSVATPETSTLLAAIPAERRREVVMDAVRALLSLQ